MGGTEQQMRRAPGLHVASTALPARTAGTRPMFKIAWVPCGIPRGGTHRYLREAGKDNQPAVAQHKACVAARQAPGCSSATVEHQCKSDPQLGRLSEAPMYDAGVCSERTHSQAQPRAPSSPKSDSLVQESKAYARDSERAWN